MTASGDVFFNYPPVRETVEATLREVVRCTRERIRINTFMLDATSSLKAFIEQLTEINRGRAFFTTPETLGDYVLVDSRAQRQLARSPRRLNARAAIRSPCRRKRLGCLPGPSARSCSRLANAAVRAREGYAQ